MRLFIAVFDYVLVVLYIFIARMSSGTSRKLYAACVVLWLMCAIINTGLFISQL